METATDSLNAQHVQLILQLETVVTAGRANRWLEYRQRFAALREGLTQHMAYEEESLFPLLERTAASAVRELRDEHARLRRHLDVLGAAAPEQDPEGCLAELDALAVLLHAHHAAEMALDPQYATRPMPRLARSEPPVPLYGLLRERGYAYAGSPRSDGGFELLITQED